MTKSRLLTLFVLTGMCSHIACTKSTLNLPEPAQTIEGEYESGAMQMPFTLKGQTLRLTVHRVAADSVSVLVRASDKNGQYRDSLSFARAYVSQVSGYNCIGYRVNMGTQQPVNQLLMTCDEINVFKYIYKSANQQDFSIVKFRKI